MLVSASKEKIEGFFREMGIAVALSPFGGSAPGEQMWTASFSYNNVEIMTIVGDQWLLLLKGFGYVPKGTVAPLLRRLLELNSSFVYGTFLCIASGAEDPQIQVRLARPIEGIDSAQFKALLDKLVAAYWQNAMPLVPEFQIPDKPG